MLSLRFKLTLYYLAILSAILLFFGFAIYTYLTRSLLSTIDQSLLYQATRIETHFAVDAGADVTDLSGDGDEQLLQLSSNLIQVFTDNWVVTSDIHSSQNERLPIERDELQQLELGKPDFKTVKLPNGAEMRVVTLRAKDHESSGTYFIRLGQSLEPLRGARRHSIIVLSIAIPLALLLGSYGGLYLANQALGPVDRITRAAEQIAGGDLTERVPESAKMDEIGRLAATFNLMISRLQAAFERQRQFTSDASHELRTPLAVMRGDIEVALRRDRSAVEYREALESNLEEIVRLSRLVEDLLMLARGDAGRVELRREPVDLNKLCQQMVEYISPLADQKEQTLSFAGPDAQVIVSADMLRIKQLLLNLLDNAIKYTEPRGKIILGLKAEDKEAVITVTDTGRGIPPEDLPFIFERFFRRSAKLTDRSATGFGLGLSIVKWIVDSHGGKIEAQSEVGKGTTFTVRLPLREA